MRFNAMFIPDSTDDIHVLIDEDVLVVQRVWKIGEHASADDLFRVILTSPLQVALLKKRGIE